MSIINWTPYGHAEYEISWRIRPKHLAEPKRFEYFPRRNRHCNDIGQFHRLVESNNRIISRLNVVTIFM
jgi:hypothetical protein